MNHYRVSTMLAEQRQALSEWNDAIRAFESFGIHAPQAYYRQREEIRLTIARLELIRFDRAYVRTKAAARAA